MTRLTVETARETIERQFAKLQEIGYTEASGLCNGQSWDGSFWAMILTFVRDELPRLLSQEDRADVEIPVLLVIPDRIVPLAKQMRLTSVFGKPGRLGNGAIHDFLQYAYQEPPGTYLPYALLDVRVGTGQERDMDGDDLNLFMANQRRLELTAAEGIALTTHYPEVIPGGIQMTGTRWSGTVASIHGIEPWKHRDDQPYELSRASYGYRVFGCGRIAHCARRLSRPPRCR